MKSRLIARLHEFRIPPRDGEAKHSEFGRAKKGLGVCSSCSNVYYHKEWRQPHRGEIARAMRDHVAITRTLCPACSLISKGLFEGELILRNIPATIEQEVGRLIRGFGRRATRRDPQHRIVALEQGKAFWRITTTENQLAVKLAKKIRETFKKAVLTISYSREPFEVGRVNLMFA